MLELSCERLADSGINIELLDLVVGNACHVPLQAAIMHSDPAHALRELLEIRLRSNPAYAQSARFVHLITRKPKPPGGSTGVAED